MYNYKLNPSSGSELLWFHPHFDGSSFLQLTNGLAGAFEIVDPEQEAKCESTRSRSEPKHTSTHTPYVDNLGGPGELLVVQMANLLPDENVSNSILYANLQTGSKMPLDLTWTGNDSSAPKFAGTLLFINGDLKPTMSVDAGKWQRLKIINAMGGVKWVYTLCKERCRWMDERREAINLYRTFPTQLLTATP